MPSPNEITRRPMPKSQEMPDEVRDWFRNEGATIINTTLVDALAAKMVLAFPGLSFEESKVYVRELVGVSEADDQPEQQRAQNEGAGEDEREDNNRSRAQTAR